MLIPPACCYSRSRAVVVAAAVAAAAAAAALAPSLVASSRRWRQKQITHSAFTNRNGTTARVLVADHLPEWAEFFEVDHLLLTGIGANRFGAFLRRWAACGATRFTPETVVYLAK